MQNSRAFTLIELLLSLALLSTILCFSIPFATSMLTKNQIQVIQNDIKSAIRYAKTEALTSGNTVILKPLHGSNDWSNGMVLLVDNKLLHEWRWSSYDIQIKWRGFQSRNYLRFSSDVSRNTINGYFEITDGSKQVLKLVVNRLGRVRVGGV